MIKFNLYIFDHVPVTVGGSGVAFSEARATMQDSRDTIASPPVQAHGPRKLDDLATITNHTSLDDSVKPRKRRRKRSSKVGSSSYGYPSHQLSAPIKGTL